MPSKGLPSSILNELCPQPLPWSLPAGSLLRTVGPEALQSLQLAPSLPASSFPTREWFFPFRTVEILRFLSAHPASLVSAPEQAENGYLDVTGGVVAGGGVQRTGALGQVAWWQAVYPLRR